ncbi:hypothetical protein [Rheinheimera sp. MMS21-TC3]|uniref:hypothetical protein n=1 Tax=Rheinheimera sp. MMS21-TC3 TaxID=3072790 RepID=UPI0028C3C706|nr:hypothetical protein [Rheinheimera sp. MMS21-TC3]WNO60746.1 hypothetical protein RDV63_07225 [Rheinheimera sp. MMS21-TC3]
MLFRCQSACCFLLLLLLNACSDPAPSIATQWGTPEAIATEFFDALYNTDDFEKVKYFSTKKYAALLDSYGTTRQVSRILINISFDNVDISINPSSQNVRQQYEEEADISVVLIGHYENERIAEVRLVTLVQHGGRWLVNSVKEDKLSRSAH